MFGQEGEFDRPKSVKGELTVLERFKGKKEKTKWGYCEECNKRLILANEDGLMHCKDHLKFFEDKYGSQKSMTQLRKDILEMIGFEMPSQYDRYSHQQSNYFSREELIAVYEWVTKKNGKKEKEKAET